MWAVLTSRVTLLLTVVAIPLGVLAAVFAAINVPFLLAGSAGWWGGGLFVGAPVLGTQLETFAEADRIMTPLLGRPLSSTWKRPKWVAT